MAAATETLEKAAHIIQTELTRRLQGQPRIDGVSAKIMLAGEDEFVHAVVVFEGDRRQLDPRMLNAFALELEPLLLKIGIHPVPTISYVNKNEIGVWTDPQVTYPQENRTE